MHGLEKIEDLEFFNNSNDNLLVIVDYTKPSTEERLFVIDLRKKQLLISSLVTHGRGTGGLYATNFSNKNNSYSTSSGFYLTGNIYNGKHGESLVCLLYTSLFQDEINFIEEKYKIKILEIKNIDNGILNSNFCVITKNKKYILRIYEANRTLDEEKQELILLDKIASFIPVSIAIKNVDNEYISVFNNKKFALFEDVYKRQIYK